MVNLAGWVVFPSDEFQIKLLRILKFDVKKLSSPTNKNKIDNLPKWRKSKEKENGLN